MFFALKHVEVAARLEYMAEARGRPRPGQMHPDAEVEDPDGVRGGKREDSDAEFEKRLRFPGATTTSTRTIRRWARKCSASHGIR